MSDRPRVHQLKTLPRMFAAIADGTKTFEVRLDDRAYAEGDLLVLRHYDPAICDCGGLCSRQRPLGAAIHKRVSYVLPGGQFGIDPAWVVLGLHDVRIEVAT